MNLSFFGQFLVRTHVVSGDELTHALRLMDDRNASFLEVATARGFIGDDQADELSQTACFSPLTMADVAIRSGAVTSAQSREIIQALGETRLRLGEALVELGFLDEAALQASLQAFNTQGSAKARVYHGLPDGLRDNPLSALVVEFLPRIIERMTGLKVKVGVGEPIVGQEIFGNGGMIKIFGQEAVEIGLYGDDEFAVGLFRAVLGDEADSMEPIPELLGDSVGEVLNTIAGHALMAIEQQDKRCDMDTPQAGAQPDGGYYFGLATLLGRACLLLK